MNTITVSFVKIFTVYVDGVSHPIRYHRFVEMPIPPQPGMLVRDKDWQEIVASVEVNNGEVVANTLAMTPSKHVKTESELAGLADLYRPAGWEGPIQP